VICFDFVLRAVLVMPRSNFAVGGNSGSPVLDAEVSARACAWL
jgi:hypothetical protein